MTQAHDIREFKRMGHHAGRAFVVYVRSIDGKFFLAAIEVAEYPKVVETDGPGFDDLDEVMNFGRARAKEYIDDL